MSEEVCWELLPSEAVQEATSLTQISELLMPGTSRMHALKNTQAKAEEHIVNNSALTRLWPLLVA